MVKNKFDFKSRFRILKGGKISLVVIGLLFGNILNAASLTLTNSGIYSTLGENSTLTISDGTYNMDTGEDVRISGSNKSFTISLTNNGIINFTDSSYGLYTYQTKSGSSMINNGTVNSNNSGGNAYGLYATLQSSDILENTGDVLVNGSSGSKGIYLYGSSSGGTVTNSGTISAKKANAYDESAYSVQSYSPTNASFTNTSSGVMNGNIKWKDNFTNEGEISLPYNATAEIANFTNTGTLEIGLLTDGTTTTYSKLATTTATFNTGSKLNVNVLSASTNENLLGGTTFADVVSASDTLTVNDLTVTDNSALLNFDYSIDGNTIDLKAVQGQTIEEAVTSSYEVQTNDGGGQTPAQNAAKALDKVQKAGTYTAMNDVFTALNKLQTNNDVADAVESTTPQTASSSFATSSMISQGISNIVIQRQNVNLGGISSGDEIFAERNLWVKPYGSIGSQNDKDGLNGFDINTYGLAIGVDGELDSNQTIGLGLFYTNANVDVNNVSQESDLDVFSAVIYGSAPIIDNKTKITYQAGYSVQKTNSDREVFTGDTASAKYTSKIASLDLKILRDYKVNDELLLQPMISTTYRHFKNPSYSETGASALNLDVKSFTSSELLVGIGVIAHYKINQDGKIIGNVNVDYDLHDDAQTVTSSYQGSSGVDFDTTGIDNGRVSYDLGIGYENQLNELSNMNISFNRQGKGSDYTNNVVSAKYTYKF